MSNDGRMPPHRIETTFGPSYSSVTTVSFDDVQPMENHSVTQNSESSFSSFGDCQEQVISFGGSRGKNMIPRPLTRSDSFNYFQSQTLSNSTSTLSNLSLNSPSCLDDDRTAVLFVETPSEQLFCKICSQVFLDPFIMSCGHSFCKKCTETCDSCPVHKKKMSVLLPNLALGDQIGALMVHCRYGCKLNAEDGKTYVLDPAGCTHKLKFADRKDHERGCVYAPISCPNNPNCPPMLRLHLQEHLKICKNCTCQYKRYGCQFVGDKEQLMEHKRSCRYELVKDFLHKFDDQVNQLRQESKQRDDEIAFLRSMLTKANERLDDSEKGYERKLELLSSNQAKLVDELDEMKQQNILVNNQLQELNTRLHMGGIGVFDPQQIFKCKGTFVGHSGPVWCLCAHGDFLFSGSSDKQIKVWDTATNYRCQKTLEGHDGIVLALTAYNDKLFSGSADWSIKVWSIDTLEELASISAHENAVCTLVCCGNKLFSGSLKSIKVWSVESSDIKFIRDLEGLNHWVRALVAHNNYLYSGSYQTIKIWDVSTLECIHVLQTSDGSVYSIAVTNHHIICGTYENCIHVWNQRNYEPVAKLTGHTGIVYALAVLSTPEQTKIFSASYDRSLRVWSMENMICTQTLIRHQGSVVALAISRGRVFSGGVDFTVKVWQ